MRNILLGFDNSRSAHTALQQAIALAAGLEARLHIIQAVEPTGPVAEIELGPPEDPVAFLDRTEAMMAGEDELALPPDDDLAAAVRQCEDARVVCSWRRLHGMAVRMIREHCPAMDMLVLGRRGTTGRRPVGAVASNIISRPIIPTLLCREDVVPWRRVLLAFDATPAGGRALKIAGELANRLNLNLDLLVVDADRSRARKVLECAQHALRAYHVEGEARAQEGRIAEALQSAALESQTSVVVTPQSRTSAWPWSRSDSVRAAIEFPTALALVVP